VLLPTGEGGAQRRMRDGWHCTPFGGLDRRVDGALSIRRTIPVDEQGVIRPTDGDLARRGIPHPPLALSPGGRGKAAARLASSQSLPTDQLAQHVVQDAAGLEVLDLVEGIDAAEQLMARLAAIGTEYFEEQRHARP